MGANPLAWSDIRAWAKLTGNRPKTFELKALRVLDNARVTWLNKPEAERKAMQPATPKALAASLRTIAAPRGKKQPAKKREA